MYTLTGLAEGMTGHHQLQAASLDEIFKRFPALAAVRDKLDIAGTRISGFAACDG